MAETLLPAARGTPQGRAARLVLIPFSSIPATLSPSTFTDFPDEFNQFSSLFPFKSYLKPDLSMVQIKSFSERTFMYRFDFENSVASKKIQE